MRNATLIAMHEAFGWKVGQMGLKAGMVYRVFVTPGTTRENLPGRTLWTKGRITGTNGAGHPVQDRIPGAFSLELPEPKPGFSTLEAASDAEWWCVDKAINGGYLPEVGVLRVPEGQSITLAPGTKLLVCDGVGQVGGVSLSPGTSLETPTATPMTAQRRVLALTFDRSNS